MNTHPNAPPSGKVAGGAPVLHLPAALDAKGAGALARQWADNIAEGKGLLILNTDACVEFDSSVLALLLACRRHASAAKRPIQITHAGQKIKQLAEVYGVADLLFNSRMF